MSSCDFSRGSCLVFISYPHGLSISENVIDPRFEAKTAVKQSDTLTNQNMFDPRFEARTAVKQSDTLTVQNMFDPRFEARTAVKLADTLTNN